MKYSCKDFLENHLMLMYIHKRKVIFLFALLPVTIYLLRIYDVICQLELIPFLINDMPVCELIGKCLAGPALSVSTVQPIVVVA